MISMDALAGFVRKNEPTSYYGAGTPLFLASQIAIFGQRYFFLRIGNILLFAASLFFFRGICRLWMSELWANIATIFMALSPLFIIFNQLFLTEMPFLCCELGTFFFFFRYLRDKYRRDLILSAVFVALSLLVRTNLLLFVPILTFIIVMKSTKLHALIYVAVVFAIVSPYCIRNSINNKAFFPFDGKGALNLWQFNSDVHTGGFWSENFEHAPVMPPLAGLTEKQRADLLMGIGVTWIKDHPVKFLRFALMKGVRFLSPLPQKAENRNLALLLSPYSAAIIVGFFIGLSALNLKDPEHLLIILLFCYTLLIDMVFMSATRHRLLFDPFFILVTFKWITDQKWAPINKNLSHVNTPVPQI